MNRRQLVAAIGGSLLPLFAGCLGSNNEEEDTVEFSKSEFKDDYFPDHDELAVITEDEFPDQIEGGHRGAGDEPFNLSPEEHGILQEEWDTLDDAGGTCGGQMQVELFAEMQEQFPDARPQVTTGIDNEFPDEVDGFAIYVNYRVRVKDGEVVATPVDDYAEFVSKIPYRGHILDWDGDILCTMPIYVRYRVREVDEWDY